MAYLLDPKKAHSYGRLSTKKQERGHGAARQMAAALKWCKENDMELDLESSIFDSGFSGYAGANVKRGSLGVLQAAAINGEIAEGTILLVESFDRITRMPLPQAYELLLSLINNGLVVVTLSDGKRWSSKTMKSLESFLLSLVNLYRGFEESQTKSDRLRATFDDARKTRKQSKFGSAPGWLSRENKDSPWVVDAEKAAVVQKVFEMSALGYGTKAIAKRANEEKWVVPMRLNMTDGRWHARMPGIILRNRAVLGYHEHKLHTHEAHAESYRGLPTGIVHHDYYPRIISDELWEAARMSIATRTIPKRRDTHYYNIFSGLMYCGYCGAPIHRRTETVGYSRGTLNCADKVAGLTKCPPCAAVTVDAPVLEAIFKYQPDALLSDEHATELTYLDSEITRLKEELSRITETILKVGSLDTLTDKLKQLSMELDINTVAKETLIAARANTYIQTDFQDGIIEEAIGNLYIPDLKARDYRAALHLRVSRLVESIFIWAYEVAVIKFKHTGDTKVVPLDYKRLPSRANTLAKWHKPPKPKNPPPRPNLEAALAGTLKTPTPRRAATKPIPALAAPVSHEEEA